MRNFLLGLTALILLAANDHSFAQAQHVQRSSVSPSSPAPRQTPSPVLRIEPVGTLKLDSDSHIPWWNYLVPAVGSVVSGLLAFFGAWLGLRFAQGNTLKTIETMQRTSDAALWQKANETELTQIQEKLDRFYFPFLQISKANHQFAQDLRQRQSDGNYRMLNKLFDAEWVSSLSAGDKRLVEIVCTNADLLEKFIADRAGTVDEKILPYLSRASAHFRILWLAYKSELGNDPTRFKDYVYPRQLDSVLTLEVGRLQQRVERLRANPGSSPGPMEPLAIPGALKLPPWPDPDGRLHGSTS